MTDKGKLVVPGRVSGKEAVAIMLGEIGDVIGGRRLRAMEPKVRAKVPPGATGNDWLLAIAQVIVENSDVQADKGFRRGLAKIREVAASRSAM